MRIEILHGGQMIARVELGRLDPPMGVAPGPPVPGFAYDRLRQAKRLDERENPGVGAELSARKTDGRTIDCNGVTVEDHSDSLGEIEVTVFGVPDTAHEAYFGSRPAYAADWRDG